MVKNLFRVVFIVVFGAMSAGYDVVEGMNNQHVDGIDLNFSRQEVFDQEGCFYFHTEDTNENILESTAVLVSREAWVRMSSPLLHQTLINQIASGVQIQNLHGSHFARGNFVLYFRPNEDVIFNEALTNDIIHSIEVSLDSHENPARGVVDLNCFQTEIVRNHISESLRVWRYLPADAVFLFVPVSLTEYGTRRRDEAVRAQQSQDSVYEMRYEYFPENEDETDTGPLGFQIPQYPIHARYSNSPTFDFFDESSSYMASPVPSQQQIIEPFPTYNGLPTGTTHYLPENANNNSAPVPQPPNQIMIASLPDTPYPLQLRNNQHPFRVSHPTSYSYINFLTHSATDTEDGASHLLTCLCGMIDLDARLKSYFDARFDLQVQLVTLGITGQIRSATQILRQIQDQVRNQSNEPRDNFFFFYVEFPDLKDMNTLNVCDALKCEISALELQTLIPQTLLSDRDVRTHVYNATIAQKNGAADHGIQIRGCFILLSASPTASENDMNQAIARGTQIIANLSARH